MNVYLDSSVLLRVLLKDPKPLQEWPRIETGYSSELLRVEVRRSLDRLWLRNKLTDEALASKSSEATQILAKMELVRLTDSELRRASDPFPTPLGTLDALHLATALRIRQRRLANDPPLLFATHDRELAVAARALHFEVLGA